MCRCASSNPFDICRDSESITGSKSYFCICFLRPWYRALEDLHLKNTRINSLLLRAKIVFTQRRIQQKICLQCINQLRMILRCTFLLIVFSTLQIQSTVFAKVVCLLYTRPATVTTTPVCIEVIKILTQICQGLPDNDLTKTENLPQVSILGSNNSRCNEMQSWAGSALFLSFLSASYPI